MRFEENPPDAASLMMSARSFGNYDLPGALADLIDNSIRAGAREIWLTCNIAGASPEIRIRDNGHGMTSAELRSAMRPASANPMTERSPDDLGRFGWGMKSASFSQCTRLLVLSRRSGELSGCVWDLEDVEGWRMGVLEPADLETTTSPEIRANDGVEVVWLNCDRLTENGTLSVAESNGLIAHARNRLALVFHRYLANEGRGRRLTIWLNGQKIEPWDPFYQGHDATQELEPESLQIGGGTITIQPFILPHYSKLIVSQYERLGGEEGYLRNQGFYVYRNHRLIISGTWFRLIRHGELSQLVRIRVDIPNALDHVWKITIDKSDAQLPAVLRTRLRHIVEKLRKRSAKVFRSRGGRLDRPGTTSVWSRHTRGGEIHYSINRDHPVIEALLETGDDQQRIAASTAIKIIEQAFPVAAFGNDAANGLDMIHQTLSDQRAFREDLEAALPLLLNQANEDLAALKVLLRKTEPWCEAWTTTEQILKEKGWWCAGPP
jgi:hypothetical protein